MTTYVSVDDIVYNEGDAFAVFTVRLTGTPLLTDLSLIYSTVDGTATAGLDFAGTPVPALATIPAGSSTFVIQIAVQTPGDGFWNGALEGFSLDLSTVTPGVVITNTRVTAIQIDADTTPLTLPATPEITAGNAVVDESTGLVSVTVTLDAPSDTTITVDYTTQDASAFAGEDYTAATGTLTILAGHTSATLTVAVSPDVLVEGREVFSVLFSNPVGATLFDDRAHVIIQDASDPVPTLPAVPLVSVQGSTVSEVAGYVDFLITLDAPSATDVSVHYATADGNGQNAAFDGIDYIAAAGDITFAPGEVSKLVRVFTIDNPLISNRGSVSFDMDLTAITGALGDQISAPGVLIDDESPLPDSIAPVVISARSPGDILIGTEFNDRLVGNQGDDLLDGRGLGDTMEGGRGEDVYIVEDADDVVTEVLGEGLNDTVISYVAAMTLANEVETLVLGGSANNAGTGNGLDNFVIGNSGANALGGGAGSDVLEGGLGNDTLDGGTGIDGLSGGVGNDTYLLGADPDVVTEFDGEGTADTVITSAAYVLTDFVENLQLTGTNNIAGIGNAENNNITGNDGNNTLDGLAGNDTLSGGLGNDTYVVDSVSDVVVETSGAGTGTADVVQASVTTTLSANVENLVLAAGAGAIDGTGNAENNTLTGNSAANTLDGLGGNDTMIGGDGSDTYVVDSISDVVTEQTGAPAGTADTVRASVSTTLSAFVENLVLTGTAATGLGNDENNSLTGNGVANTLDGGLGNDRLDGGAAADNLIGGDGDDTYIVDNSGDIVTELAGIGTGADAVEASATYTLSANVETLLLTGLAAIDGTGNAEANTLTGNSAANTLDGLGGNDTLIGGDGSDTYVVDSISDVVTEQTGAAAGTADTVRASVDTTLSAFVENLVLTGTAATGLGNAENNSLIGNGVANTLEGSLGNDTLDGGAGLDNLIGGDGDDTYVVDTASDVVTEAAGAGTGTDTVQASANYTLVGNIENLALTGSGAINGTGNDLDNSITGNAGNNVLDGGLGLDTLSGGTGDDTYQVDSATDVITENVGEGSDSVVSSVNLSLAANVDNLTLVGSATSGSGNALNNVLTGNSAANTLNGGAGVDTMVGGQGNDVYFVDNTSDVVTEVLGEGTDLVQSSASYTLGANVEQVILTGSASVNATGNELANFLVGNAGVNTLSGGAGNDTYTVGAGDTVVEGAAQGTDLVQSAVSWVLSANVENLTLTGTAAVDATGNDLGNVLTGNTGANVLTGGAGNDTYVVGAGDSVVEGASQGTDVVQSAVSWVLSANVENLTLLGTASVDATGNDLNNTLTGNIGNNLISGGAGNDTINAGSGVDTAIGGLGNDLYFVDNTADVITELAGEGNEVVQAFASYTLSANLETLVLVGVAAINGTGNELGNLLLGNTAGNQLNAAAGNDVLNGGAGADTMSGGLGIDTYHVDNVGDVIVEAVGEGVDYVQASVSHTLSANVENLTLTGAAAINGTGSADNNVLTGNAGANVLSGAGGNDTYVVGAGDSVVEALGEGTDLVQSALSWTLSANVENLTLTGAGATSGTGNTQDNVLSGNAGANVLTGGAGNDTYVVGTGDTTVELVGEGTDTVRSAVNWTLAANVENLTLTGTGAISGTGNDLANTMTGNVSSNLLVGGIGNDTINGGASNDTMNGGQGNDLYFVDNTGDVITEAVGEGTDQVQSSVSYTLGANVEQMFLTGAAAINATGNALGNTLIGNGAANVISGGLGNDALRGGLGNDTFVFDTALNAATNVDNVVDFTAGDHLQLSAGIFSTLTSGGTLAAGQFFSGAGLTGGTGAGGVYYDTTSGGVYYDADGAGALASTRFATLTGLPALTSNDFFVG